MNFDSTSLKILVRTGTGFVGRFAKLNWEKHKAPNEISEAKNNG